VTDTPIYDQLRQELQDAAAAAPPRQRARSTSASADRAPKQADRTPKPQETPAAPDARQPVSVWTLVNANRRKR
jgi:hypothetical protein